MLPTKIINSSDLNLGRVIQENWTEISLAQFKGLFYKAFYGCNE